MTLFLRYICRIPEGIFFLCKITHICMNTQARGKH